MHKYFIFFCISIALILSFVGCGAYTGNAYDGVYKGLGESYCAEYSFIVNVWNAEAKVTFENLATKEKFYTEFSLLSDGSFSKGNADGYDNIIFGHFGHGDDGAKYVRGTFTHIQCGPGHGSFYGAPIPD